MYRIGKEEAEAIARQFASGRVVRFGEAAGCGRVGAGCCAELGRQAAGDGDELGLNVEDADVGLHGILCGGAFHR